MLKQQSSVQTERLPSSRPVIIIIIIMNAAGPYRLLAGPVFADVCGLYTFITPCEWHECDSDESD